MEGKEGGGNMSKSMMGGGAIFVAIAITLTQYFGLPGYLYYVWAVLVLVWGLKAFK